MTITTAEAFLAVTSLHQQGINDLLVGLGIKECLGFICTFVCSVCFTRSVFVIAGYSSSEESNHSELDSLRAERLRDESDLEKLFALLTETIGQLKKEIMNLQCTSGLL